MNTDPFDFMNTKPIESIKDFHDRLVRDGAVVVGYVPAGCKIIERGRAYWIEWPDGSQEPLPKAKPPAP